eukprot:comp14937_c0_seq1/m.11518 comp14937_c0_seq1/g.11518  ORF comp14937_c0_seq1/g.11518 comp14937_c0_seq1/m.11518 type:complete len:630 (-) comp14937_c0_seq1:25-1914(-)
MAPFVFVFGLGYTGLRFAEHLQHSQPDWAVGGTVRSSESAARLRARGLDVHVLDSALEDIQAKAWQKQELAVALSKVTHVLVTAAPVPGLGDPVLGLLGDVLLGLKDTLQWVGYLSTTGVYGNKDGAWVDEDSPLTPTSKRGQLRVDAETAWLATGLPVHIFRLPGIYGPGRGTIAKIRENGQAKRILKPGHMFSRIHVDDIVAALCASVAQPHPTRVYNVVDDEPAPQHVVVEYACELLGLDLPPLIPFEQADMTPMAISFYAENKRCSNKRLKEELGLVLRYPTYREGLKAQLDEERARGMDTPIGPKGGLMAGLRNVAWLLLAATPLLGPLYYGVRRVVANQKPRPPVCLVIDNGSRRAASTLSLRQAAGDLQRRLGDGVVVRAVSSRHWDKVSPSALGGVSADIYEPLLMQLGNEGYRDIVVLPFFFGPSAAITDYVPERTRHVMNTHPRLHVRIAPPLVDTADETDTRIAAVLVDRIRETKAQHNLGPMRVVVCDHGSPLAAVHQVRPHLVAQVKTMLGSEVLDVVGSSMERRDGPEYDFNEPLLERVFDTDGYGSGDVIISLVFLSPGRHAGEGGDIATILAEAEAQRPGLKTYMTGLVGSHQTVCEVLAQRYNQGLNSTPVR